MRVQIPPYTDMWMRGDRYGEVVKIVVQPHPRKRDRRGRQSGFGTREIATVKLDISGRTIRVILADCQEVGR